MIPEEIKSLAHKHKIDNQTLIDIYEELKLYGMEEQTEILVILENRED